MGCNFSYPQPLAESIICKNVNEMRHICLVAASSKFRPSDRIAEKKFKKRLNIISRITESQEELPPTILGDVMRAIDDIRLYYPCVFLKLEKRILSLLHCVHSKCNGKILDTSLENEDLSPNSNNEYSPLNGSQTIKSRRNIFKTLSRQGNFNFSGDEIVSMISDMGNEADNDINDFLDGSSSDMSMGSPNREEFVVPC
mmetsp:Transcript_39631/g.40397  ORF Transcript_39631/g.40397 Transcript_39631/m.40397 type:complete len:199 (+) Transcript_39631:158-754(+)